MPLCGYPGMLDILSQTRKLECSVMRSHQISLTRRRSTTITTWDAGPLVGMQEERTRRPQSQLEPVLGRVISLSEMASPVYVPHREGLPTPSQAEGDQRSSFFPHTQGVLPRWRLWRPFIGNGKRESQVRVKPSWTCNTFLK